VNYSVGVMHVAVVVLWSCCCVIPCGTPILY